MNATMTGKNRLDPLSAGLTALISRGLETLFGSGVNAPVFGGVTWADLGTVLCLILFVLLGTVWRDACNFLQLRPK